MPARSSQQGRGQRRRYSQSSVKQRTNYVQEEDSEDEMYTLHQIRGSKIDPYETIIKINGKTVLLLFYSQVITISNWKCLLGF